VRRWRAEAQAVADALLDRMVAGEGPADLMTAFAYPLPIQVICRLMGVPADADRYRAWSEATMSVNPLTDLQWQEGGMMNGLIELPVRW
jgi:cytochrome P450